MRIIFLDFDGVLNSVQSRKWNRRAKGPSTALLWRDDWCPIACNNLLIALENLPDVKLVISSSWRIIRTIDELRDILVPLGIPKDRIIDKTPNHTTLGNERGHQIQDWLNQHPEVSEFVIIDDDSDMQHLRNRLVHTSFSHGLQWGDMLQIYRLFGLLDLANGKEVK